jgi:hypothetical protein
VARQVKVLTAFCDMQFCPVSYDFATWLVRAMKARDDGGYEGLHVVLVPVENGLGHIARHWGKHDEAATMWRLWHIVIPICQFARATVALAASRWQASVLKDAANGMVWWPEGKAHFMGPLVEASRRGEAIPRLRATAAARRYVAQWFKPDASIITITMRRQDTDPDRNSNLAAWKQFTESLPEKYTSICIGDSNMALGGIDIFSPELDVDMRLALYERAAMNLIGNNGPSELLKFSDCPYLSFGQALTPGWQDHWRKYFGMQPGEQLPWARPDQRLICRPDSFEVLQEEFEKWASATN